MRIRPFIYLLLVISNFSFAQTNESKHFNLQKGLALEGYDPVSYHSKEGPKMGKSDINLVYKGVTYRFISAVNKQKFESNPEMYMPAYGGWCAYAMGAKGEKVSVDVENYKIVDGKLNLFYKNFFSNTLDDWNKDEKALKSKADNSWQRTITK